MSLQTERDIETQ